MFDLVICTCMLFFCGLVCGRCSYCLFVFLCFKQKTAYEMRISDWSSDVCSSDLLALADAMDDTLAELLPLARLHAANDETADTWAHLNQAGVFGICASEDAGGSGLGAAEEALIAIGLGDRKSVV